MYRHNIFAWPKKNIFKNDNAYKESEKNQQPIMYFWDKLLTDIEFQF